MALIDEQGLVKNCSRRDTFKTSFSCLLAFVQCSFATTRRFVVVKITAMTNDKLKSTTVRFTHSDLRLIDSLRDKLGLGMIQVIRLAIRRLAEIEGVSSPLARHKA